MGTIAAERSAPLRTLSADRTTDRSLGDADQRRPYDPAQEGVPCMKISLFPIALLALLCSGTSGASAVTEPAHDGLAALEVVRPSRTCSSLLTLDLASIGGSGSRVTSASVQDTDQGVTVCNVEGTLAPSIGFFAQLPLDGWTQRYLQVGCGGLCGRISLRPDAVAGCVPFESGRFVVASTDMGHQGNGGRSVPIRSSAPISPTGGAFTARAAKALIKTFYDRLRRIPISVVLGWRARSPDRGATLSGRLRRHRRRRAGNELPVQNSLLHPGRRG